jgi:hypothetical protein
MVIGACWALRLVALRSVDPPPAGRMFLGVCRCRQHACMSKHLDLVSRDHRTSFSLASFAGPNIRGKARERPRVVRKTVRVGRLCPATARMPAKTAPETPGAPPVPQSQSQDPSSDVLEDASIEVRDERETTRTRRKSGVMAFFTKAHEGKPELMGFRPSAKDQDVLDRILQGEKVEGVSQAHLMPTRKERLVQTCLDFPMHHLVTMIHCIPPLLAGCVPILLGGTMTRRAAELYPDFVCRAEDLFMVRPH